MSLPKTTITTKVRLLAAGLCLMAFSVYFTFAPSPSYADCCDCVSGDVHYSDGDCKGKAMCICLYYNGVCDHCTWDQNNVNCGPALVESSY
jgi:hypothetical protein